MKGTAKDTMSAEEKDWRAEDDLRTLIEAEKIKRDDARLKAAMKKKREMAKNLEGVGE
ncbi:MAG: hypothetical protein RJQ08_13705 [Salinisphaeraceae bacterium]